jgi:hypothetical protein
MFDLVAVGPGALRFIDLDGHGFAIDVQTLVSLSDEGRDPRSGQRRPDVILAPGETIREAQAGWTVVLNSGAR